MHKALFFVKIFFLNLVWIGNSFASLDIHFLDVGYGDAMVMELPGGGAVLVDSGFPGKGPLVVRKLKELGIDEIKLAVVTHFHPDHAGGFESVLSDVNLGEKNKRGFSIGPIWIPTIPEVVDHSIKIVRDMILKRTHRIARRGESTKVTPSVLIEVLHPEQLTGNPNEDSLVLKISYGDISVLLTGDIGITSQRALAEQYGGRLKADIIKLPHHGDVNAPEFVSAVKPKDAVLSVGPNPYSLPKAEALEAYRKTGARIHRTDRHGTVTLRIEADEYTIHHEKPVHPE